MVDKKLIEDGFCKCMDPLDFSQKYSFFIKSNGIYEEQDILEILHIIEEKNLLGALYVLELKEKNLASKYIPGFVARHKDLFIEKIQIDNAQIVYFMQVVYLCLMNMDKEDAKALCKDIFTGELYKREEPVRFEFVNPVFVSKHYGKVFLSAVSRFGDQINWVSQYCDIISMIFEVREFDINFVSPIEFGLRKQVLGDAMDEASAKAYFELLCEHKAFDSAKQFLDNFEGKNEILGMQTEELVKKLYSYPSPGLLTVGMQFSTLKLNPEYSYDDWWREASEINKDEESLKWLKLTIFYCRLRDCLKNEDKDAFYALMESAQSYEMFDVKEHNYVKQMVESNAFIVNTLLLENPENVVEFLKKYEEINIHEHSKMRYVSDWVQLETIKTEYDYEEIKNVLYTHYSVEDAIYIYMNTHLKCIITIEEFIEWCSKQIPRNNERAGKGHEGKNGWRRKEKFALEKMFENYPLWGVASLGYKKGAVRNKIYITPIGVASNVSYQEFMDRCITYGYRSNEATYFNEKMIRCHEDRYSRNKKIAELIKDGDICEFYIADYDKKGIFATDFAIEDYVMKKRCWERENVFPSHVKAWLTKIQDTGHVYPWREERAIYGAMNLENNMARNEIAFDILRTIEVLQDNLIELDAFMNEITHPPLEEINEFRYIDTQKNLEFRYELEGKTFNELKFDVIKRAENLMKNYNIPEQLRRDIFLNTCIRKLCDFGTATYYVRRQFYNSTADEPIFMALKFERYENGCGYFSTRGGNSTLFSLKPFVYEGDCSTLTPNLIYHVSLQGYDKEKGCYILDRVNLTNDQIKEWDIYLRKVRDMKKLQGSEQFDAHKEKLKDYKVKIVSDYRIGQFTHEVNEIFKKQRCCIQDALMVLDAIGETNPYANQENDFSRFVEQFQGKYIKTYEFFLDEYRRGETAETEFCDLFFRSYLKVFIPSEQFFEDIEPSEEKREKLKMICKFVKNYNI